MTALVGLLVGYYWMWSRSRFVRLVDALPGPKPLPVLGNILHLANFSLDGKLIQFGLYQILKIQRINLFFSDVKYEPIYRIWIGYYPAVFMAHSELFEVIKNSANLFTFSYSCY